MPRFQLTAATALASILALSGPASAEGDALIIANARYSALDTLLGTARVVAPSEDFRDYGFDVSVSADADAAAMRQSFAEFVSGLEGQDGPVIAVLAGVFLHGRAGAYLLPIEDEAPDAARVLTEALPVDAVLSVLAQHPGRALLLLAESASDDELPPYLASGLGQLDIPQGVTVIRGPAADVARFAESDLVRPEREILRDARRWELTVEGYAPDGLVMLRDGDITERPPETDPERAADTAAWDTARAEDTLASYTAYLEAHPEGIHAPAARQRAAALEEAQDPFRGQRLAEEALGLSRESRRKIQRDLSLLGHDPRGIDGIFGRGTRAAIEAWQKENSLPASTFLDDAQIATLDGQARIRAAELEEQARLEREEQEKQDRIAWDAVTGPNDESGLRGYLKAYPDGLYADRAKGLLNEIEKRRAARVENRDLRKWRQTQERDTIEAYQQYLIENPEGAFHREAEARIIELSRAQQQGRSESRARQQEDALNMNTGARRLAEARLSQLQLEPGQVDGRFDGKTRQAIRRYQAARGLSATGYLDQDTVVRLLAEGLLGR